MIRLAIAPILAGAVVATGCSREAPSVVVYTAVDEHAARPVFARFTERTGIAVKPLFDGEINKTTGLAERLRREQPQPRADLFWSNEEVQIGRLAEQGVLEHGRAGLVPTFVRARVLAFDPRRVSEAELPRTWWELAEPRFADRVAMADSRFGTTAAHLAGMLAWASTRGDPGRFDEWCRGLAANRTRVLTSGNGGVVRAVAAGEAEFGMTDTDDVAAINESRGDAPLSMILLRHGDAPGEGPWTMHGLAGIVSGAPHPDAARALLDFLAGTEAQAIVASAAPGFHPVRDGAIAGIVDGLVVDAALSESSLPRALERFFDAQRTAD